MSKRKDRRQSEALYASVLAQSSASGLQLEENEESFAAALHDDTPLSDAELARSGVLSRLLEEDRPRALPMMKKFRFQLLHRWMVEHLPPGRVADVGGGKGLMAYLLEQSGWQSAVIDPTPQPLPVKYKDLETGRQVRIGPEERVGRIDAAFEPEMAKEFDLLLAMHAHGCNIQIIDAAAEYGRSFLLMPCCIIDEPVVPPPGVHWLQCVIEESQRRGFTVQPFRLNFKGQNIGLYGEGQ